jgi:hypothetical protein
MSNSEKVYLINYNLQFARRGKPAQIIGLRKYTFPNNEKVICYQLEYEDGFQAYVPIDKIKESEWRFVTLDDMLRYGSP